MSKRALPGVNIQYPISRLILDGKKTVETRTYPLPEKYLNQEMYIVETPGTSKEFKARVVAIAVFTSSFKYKNKKEFYADYQRHQVDENSPWAWKEKPKWGWEVIIKKRFTKATPLNCKTGIKFTKNIEI